MDAPLVVSVTPADAATGVTTDTTVTVVFDEPVANATVDLSGPAGAITGTTTTIGSTVIFTPDTALDNDTLHSVAVPTTVTDLAGNALAAPNITTFTTAVTPSATGNIIEADGLVVIEAEDFDTNTPRGGHDWINDNTIAGASGSQLLSNPNIGTLINTGFATTTPETTYNIDFTTTGTYNLWLRGYADTNSDNSVHFGINGTPASTADRVETDPSIVDQWTWTNDTRDGATATITITTPGTYTLNMWMREDGFRIDKIILTTTPNPALTGQGPPPSPRDLP